MLLDIDWLDFLARLDTWEALRPASQRSLMSLRHGMVVKGAEFGGDVERLVAGSFLEPFRDARSVRLHSSAAGFSRAVRFMSRHPLLERHDEHALVSYLQDLLAPGERRAVAPTHTYHGADVALARSAASVAWPRGFARGISDDPLAGPERAAARRLVAGFLEEPGPVLFRDLAGRFAGGGQDVITGAVTWALFHAVLFPVFLDGLVKPALTLWPPAARRHFAPAPAPPRPVEPADTFQGAPLLEDMTTVLLAVAADPLPIRQNDFGLYARASRRIEDDLMRLPGWLEKVAGLDLERRVGRARALLEAMGFMGTRADDGGRLALAAKPGAEAWLAASAADRLRTVLDSIRARAGMESPVPLPTVDDLDLDDLDLDEPGLDEADWTHAHGSASWWMDFTESGVPFFPSQAAIGYVKDSREAVAAAREAFRDLASGRFVSLDEFVEHRTRMQNPFLDGLRSRAHWDRTEEEREALWKRILCELVVDRLVVLGGAQAGILEGRFCFALTPAGQYLLGLTDAFEYRVEGGEGAVVVQPNLEVVFLAPAPHAEAAIARFAERAGRGMGTLFRLTPAAAYAAAAGGFTAEQALEALRGASTRPIPPNVARELRGWFESCRRVSARRALLLECPDEETAGRVLAAGAKDVRRLSQTVLEVASSKAYTRLSKRLAAAGVFLGRTAAEEGRRRR